MVSSINKFDRHDITEILLKVALNTMNHLFMIFSDRIGTDCIDSYKSNYHTAMTAPNIKRSKLDKPNMISYS
jgi:hypothetical protein